MNQVQLSTVWHRSSISFAKAFNEENSMFVSTIEIQSV
jgi:hypothetical protein